MSKLTLAVLEFISWGQLIEISKHVSVPVSMTVMSTLPGCYFFQDKAFASVNQSFQGRTLLFSLAYILYTMESAFYKVI